MGRLGFRYRSTPRPAHTRAAELRASVALAVPPAWTDVWICPDPRGHLQATGRDARGRKQYRYHPRLARLTATRRSSIAWWRSPRALPAIRRRTARDLAQRGLPREKVLAAVVQLLEKSLIRVGNDEYARRTARSA